jgi:hypothetical protein
LEVYLGIDQAEAAGYLRALELGQARRVAE